MLRVTALAAVAIGAAASVALLLRAGSRNSSLIFVVGLFIIWVLAPFAALAWANAVSTRWSRLTQVTLFAVTILVTLGSLAGYSGLIRKPEGSPNVFMFVAIPPVSLLGVAIVVSAAALLSRKSHPQ